MSTSEDDQAFSSRRLRQSRRRPQIPVAEYKITPSTASESEAPSSRPLVRHAEYLQPLVSSAEVALNPLVYSSSVTGSCTGSSNGGNSERHDSETEAMKLWSKLSARLQKGMAGKTESIEDESDDHISIPSDDEGTIFQQSEDEDSQYHNHDYLSQRIEYVTQEDVDIAARADYDEYYGASPPEGCLLNRTYSICSASATASSVYMDEENVKPAILLVAEKEDPNYSGPDYIMSTTDHGAKSIRAMCFEKGRLRKAYLCVFLLIVILLAGVLSITLPSSSRKSKELESIEAVSATVPPTGTPDPSIPSTSMPSVVSSTMPSSSVEVKGYLRDLVLSTGITSEADLANTESVQAQALSWLIRTTTAALDIPDWRYLQRYALVTFYYSTEGRDWFLQNGWLGVEHECTWFFRSPRPCNDQGVLLRLSLGFNNLGGTLPPELGLLSNIEDVSLSGGGGVKIGGTLPEELRRWTKLELFNLREQSITGMLDESLIRAWPNLTRIDLTSNRLGGNLPPSLGEMSLLRTVTLASNEFTGTIPDSYGSSGAKRLSLGNNQLTGSFPTGTMQDMRDLSFERNMIESMADSMFAPRLRRIVANDNAITGELPHFSSARALEMILLQNNTFTGTVPDSWSNLVELEEVDISSNQLEGEIPAGLTILPSLGVFRFDDNSFSSLTCPVDDRREWYADCLPVGGVPEIECPCCTHCCADNIGCRLRTEVEPRSSESKYASNLWD